MFESLDYVYVPTDDVDADARRYGDELGAELVWKVRGMGTTVACLRVSTDGPAILLSGHLEGTVPILVYRVADYASALASLRAAGIEDSTSSRSRRAVRELPRAGGQRFAVYELARPFMAHQFDGRIDD